MDGSETIPTVDCADAAELLQRLRSLQTNPPRGQATWDRWAFRGQRDARWHLVPAAYRPGTLIGYENCQFSHIATGRDLDSAEQGQAEFTAVYEFLALADQVGLGVPGDSQVFRLRDKWEQVVGSTMGTKDWPPPAVLETLAIAQHHGVPTRLLDFTYDAEVAAFFAASDALRSLQEPQSDDEAERLAVWVLDLHFLFMAVTHRQMTSFTRVTVPRAANRYLDAQSGFFLYDKHAAREHAALLDLAAAQEASRLYALSDTGIQVPARPWKVGYRFTLPTRESAPLLDLLEALGINKAKLQPSFDNVVAVLKARQDKRLAANPERGWI